VYKTGKKNAKNIFVLKENRKLRGDKIGIFLIRCCHLRNFGEMGFCSVLAVRICLIKMSEPCKFFLKMTDFFFRGYLQNEQQ